MPALISRLNRKLAESWGRPRPTGMKVRTLRNKGRSSLVRMWPVPANTCFEHGCSQKRIFAPYVDVFSLVADSLIYCRGSWDISGFLVYLWSTFLWLLTHNHEWLPKKGCVWCCGQLQRYNITAGLCREESKGSRPFKTIKYQLDNQSGLLMSFI